MIRFNGINHLAMATGDMDRTIRFWRDLLGMRLVAGLGRPEYRLYFFEISEKDLMAFLEYPDVEPIPEKDHGYPVSGPFVFDHVSFYSFDPNGIPIEFSCTTEQLDIRKNPTMVDTAPSGVTREGPEPNFGKWPHVKNPTSPEDRMVYPGEGSDLVHGKQQRW